MKKSLSLILACLLLPVLAHAWLPQKEHFVSPSTVKKVGIYRSGDFGLQQKDLFFELQNRLVYELKQVPYFDVYDYEKVIEYGALWHRSDPAAFLLSFDALVLAEPRSNGMVFLKALYPTAGVKEETNVMFVSRRNLGEALSVIENKVLKRLWFSAEIIGLPLPNRCVLNVGRNFDVREGEFFVSFVSNRRPNAVLRVEKTGDLTSQARVVWFHLPVAEGETVLRMAPDLLMNMHSRFVSVDPGKKPVLAQARRVAGIDSRNVVVSLSPHDNSFVVSDARNSFFIDPDRNRSVMIDQNRPLGRVAWKPLSHTIAYTAGNDLFVYDLDHDRKLVLVQGPSPRFVPVNLVFSSTNTAEVPEFGWNLHSSEFVFFVRNNGLFLTTDFNGVRRFAVRPVYPEVPGLQAEFSGNDEELWIKTSNHYDPYASVFRCRISDASILEEWDTASSRHPFRWSADRSGVYDLVVDDEGRTNLCLLGDGCVKTADRPLEGRAFSDDGCLMLYKEKTLRTFDLTNAEVHVSPWDQIVQEAFFPASRMAVASGFIRDTNNDKLVNWKDRRPLYLYDAVTSRSGLVLADDCDEFLGFSATGEYVFYRKAGSVFFRRLSPAESATASGTGK